MLYNVDLGSILDLLSVREKLEMRLLDVNQKLEVLFNKIPLAPTASHLSNKPARVRGALKLSIMRVLEEAGDQGIIVKDLALLIGEPAQKIHVWFQHAKKANPKIRKNAANRWMLAPEPPLDASPITSP